MLDKFDVFLFDFDGTLFDTLESSIYVFEEAYRRIGIQVDHDAVLGYTREPIPISYKRLTGSMDGYPAFIASIDELVHTQKVTDMAVIYPDTARILKYLKDHKKVVGIVTSNSREHLLDVLRRFGLENTFDIIVGNREASTPKPSPLPILKALELLKYKDKNKVVYIGDALNDAIAAKNAEVHPLLLDRLHEFGDIKEYQKIYTLDDLVSGL